MKCPNCSVDLLMAERLSLEVNYCPQCRGVWLDRGKLDSIIERARIENSPRQYDAGSDGFHDHDDHHGDDHRGFGKGRRRRSIFGDLFD